MIKTENQLLLGSLGLDRAMFVRAVLPWVRVRCLIQLMLTSHLHFNLLEEKSVVVKLLACSTIFHLQLARRIRDIKHLELEEMALSSELFSDFGTHFTNLESLTIVSKHKYRKKFRTSFGEITGFFPASLTSLNLGSLYRRSMFAEGRIQQLTNNCHLLRRYDGNCLPAHIAQLEYLSLRNNGWRGCSDQLIRAKPPLKEASFYDLSVGQAGKIMQQFATIRKLCNSTNEMGISSDEGDEWIKDEDGLQFLDVFTDGFSSLRPFLGRFLQIKVLKLRFSQASLTGDNVRDLASILPNLKFLDLSQVTTIDTVAYQNISQLVGLEGLNLSWGQNISEEAFRSIAMNCPLSWLRINNCKVQDRGFYYLSRLTQLTRLDVANNAYFKREHVLSIPPSVTHLDLSHMCDLSFGILSQSVMDWPQLTYLNIAQTDCDVPADGLIACVTKIVSLRKLVVSKATTQYLENLGVV